jgi:selT/selW/selH-like putative selenoprotein
LSKELKVDPVLVPGERGAFEVLVDGRLIFSKLSTGRFPEASEILAAIRSIS